MFDDCQYLNKEVQSSMEELLEIIARRGYFIVDMRGYLTDKLENRWTISASRLDASNDEPVKGEGDTAFSALLDILDQVEAPAY